MGLGPPVLALYHQLKALGVLDDVKSVVELGSQGVWCPDRRLLVNLFDAFDKPLPPAHELRIYINNTGTGLASSRHLHESLGFIYDCVDVDGNFGSLVLDINFDPVPNAYRGKYDLTTNHGTTEHLLHQYNAFKMIHEFTAPNGLMLHALPFTVHFEHGFFNYQPSFFHALARHNGYETLGIWVGPDWTMASFVPWEPELLDYLMVSPKTTHLLVVLQRKLAEGEFRAPARRAGDALDSDWASSRIDFVVDGEFYSDHRSRSLTSKNPAVTPASYALTDIPAVEIAKELGRRMRGMLPWA